MKLFSDNTVSSITGFVRGLIGVLAVPAREMHLTIGHSTVSAALLLVLGILGATVIHSMTSNELTGPAWAALKREREARASVYEIQATETAAQLQSQIWRLSAIRADVTGVTVEFTPITGATFILIAWNTSAGNGLEVFPITPPAAGEPPPMKLDVLIPKVRIGAAWESGKRLSIECEQRSPIGGRSRLVGRNTSVMLP